MFMNAFSEKEGRGHAEINQYGLACGGEEVRMHLRTSDSIGHQKLNRGCVYSCRMTPAGRNELRPYILDINKVSACHCEMPGNPVPPMDYARQA